MRSSLRLLPLALLAAACQPEETPATAFDEAFLWGTASAAWQVEGDFDPDPDDGFDVRSNWTVWTERGCVHGEQTNPRGVDFHQRYAEDFALGASIGNNSYRLTIDWTRIEPTNDGWNDAELAHYAEVLAEMTAQGMVPMVTLWHWVMPTWVQNPTGDADAIDLLSADAGPDSAFVAEFEEFVRYVAPTLGEYVDLYSILNEPFSVIANGYMAGGCGGGGFPPGNTFDLDGARSTAVNLVFAHAAACDALRELDGDDVDEDGIGALCGSAATNNVVRPRSSSNPDDVTGAERIDWIYNHLTMEALTAGNLDLDFDGAFTTTTADDPDLAIDEGHYPQLEGTLDWHGINYYGPIVVDGLPNSVLGGLPNVRVDDYDPNLPHSTLGFAIDAPGFGEILDAFAVYDLPLYITENGLGDNTDADRPMFLVEHLDQVQSALGRGVDVRGYYHWSLTDNFEWAEGFDQRFGLFRVDFDDPAMPRIRQRSVDAYEAIIRAGEVTEDIRSEYLMDRYTSDGRTELGR